MPIYEYYCSACKAGFEVLRSLKDSDKDAECPTCHAPAPRKLSTFSCYSISSSGIPTPLSGSGGPSCSGCNSDSCSSCGS